MAPFWDSISSSFGRSNGFDLSASENADLPPTSSGKRKASEPRRSSRSSKARRYAAPDSFPRVPITYTALSEEEGEGNRPSYLAQRQERLSDIVEEDKQSPRVTGFIGHRNSMDRNSSPRKGSASKRHSSNRQGSAYIGSSTGTRRRPSTPTTRASVKSAQGANEDYLSGVASAVKTAFFKLTGTGGAESKIPADTEADLQAQLQAECPDEEIQTRFLAEFQEDDYDDAKLSEREWGRRHFGPAPWAKHKVQLENKIKLKPQIKSPPVRTGTPAPNFGPHNPKPPAVVKPVAVKKPEERLVKPADRPAYKPVVETPSPAKPTTLKQSPTHVTKNVVGPVQKPAVEPPEYIKEWTEAPYQRLRTIHEKYPTSYLTQAQKELQEPMYTIRDVEIRDMLWQIQDGIEEVAALFQGTLPSVWGRNKSNTLTSIYPDPDVSTSRVLKVVAGQGWTDKEGWHDIFASDQKRRALVCGIIGNVIVEQVFKHPFFGGDKENIDTLFQLQKKFRDEDVFVRKYASAGLLASNLIGKKFNVNPNGSKTILHPPENFTTHVDVVVAALDTHLRPLFLKLCTFNDLSKESTAGTHWSFIEALTRLVGTAGLLSLQMAVDPFTVYYNVPVANGDRFSHALHGSLNSEEMKRSHPRNPGAASASEESKKRARNDNAVISMVLMNGLTAYRAGGWEAPESDPKWDGKGFVGRVYAREGDVGVGYRGRVLSHGWVFCKWGRVESFDVVG